MKKEVKAILVGLILTFGLLASACPQRMSIAHIEANPSRYFDKEVAVAGTVEDSYGVSIPVVGESLGVYKISDGTGSIWVVTRRSIPTKGTQLAVKGRLQNGINYNGKNYGIGISEDDRRFNKR